MRFITFNSPQENFKVQLEGQEEDQNCFSTLAENLLGPTLITEENKTVSRVQDTYAGKIVRFGSNKEFKKFLFWRAIFNQCAPNKTFSFLSFARNAVQEVRRILKTDVVEIC